MDVYEVLLWKLKRHPASRLCKYCMIGCLLVIIVRYLTGSQPDWDISAADTGDRAYRRVAVHSKWIVVTTINHPTKAMISLSQLTDWKMVVVGDRKTPSDWAITGVVFLNLEAQRALGYRTTPLLPFDSYARKTVGYLYAIEMRDDVSLLSTTLNLLLWLQHGARYIYDTDDDNVPLDDLKGFHVDEDITRGLMPATDDITYNPYPHFGQASMWPRGYSLEEIGQESTCYYSFCSIHQASIRQAVVNGDPDVDAIFRLTRRYKNERSNLSFDAAAPPIVIPQGTFVPFNSQNTMFVSVSFWALVLPTTVSDRSSDIYRSYWAQALLWLVGGHLGFYPPTAMHVRNEHSSLNDFEEEMGMYRNMGHFLRFLHSWKCDHLFLFDCMTKLAQDMSFNKFIDRHDIDVINAWVADLAILGYAPPVIRRSSTCSHAHSLVYFPHAQNTSFAHISSMSHVGADLAHRTTRVDLLRDVCSEDIFIASDAADLSMKPHNLLLIVTTSEHVAKTIPLLNAYYKRCFPHILFCGPSTPDRNLLHKWRISYLTMSSTVSGTIPCVHAASEMGYNVDGIMLVTDKMLLLSSQKLHTGLSSKMLVAENTPELSQLCTENAAKCLVLSEHVAKDLSAKLDTLNAISRVKLKLKQCFRKLVSSAASETFFAEEVAFYVPVRLFKLFNALTELYTGQFSHVTVLLLGCLETKQQFLTSARQISTDTEVDVIFPFLISNIDTDNSVKKQYCKSLRSY